MANWLQTLQMITTGISNALVNLQSSRSNIAALLEAFQIAAAKFGVWCLPTKPIVLIF